MMWNEYQVYEKYDWDERDQSFRKQKKVGKGQWFNPHEVQATGIGMPERTEEMIQKNQYWSLAYTETVFQKERPAP